MKSHQKNWRESQSRGTEVGEKIAVTSTQACLQLYMKFSQTKHSKFLQKL